MLWSIDQLVSTGWTSVIGYLTKRQALELHRQYRRSFNRPFRVRRMSWRWALEQFQYGAWVLTYYRDRSRTRTIRQASIWTRQHQRPFRVVRTHR